MGRVLGQPVIIENVVGAGGTIGSTRAMRANRDGYTLLMGNSGTHAFSVALNSNLAYKPDTDFQPIGKVVENAAFIVGRKDLPAKDLTEFIAYAKANAEKLNMGHAGVGSGSFTQGLLLNSLLGVKPALVPFGGGGPATTALLAGQIDYVIGLISDFGPYIQSGMVKAYAIGAVERSRVLPNVPTSKEAGLPEFQASTWSALFAPKGTPQPILDKLSAALDNALDDEEVRKRLVELGGDIPGTADRGQQPLAVLVKSEIARWTPILKAARDQR
jgi:tripartite-type tricarboxylate transporter receptor subunit TctC